MDHKQKMDWLKENDPITYYELTSNPTGADSDTTSVEVWFVIILALVLVGMYNLIF
jgi:hypothetical protein